MDRIVQLLCKTLQMLSLSDSFSKEIYRQDEARVILNNSMKFGVIEVGKYSYGKMVVLKAIKG